VRPLLLIAYHFPPVFGSSGLQRTLRFAQYLPEFGWQPIVLTVRPDAYEQTDERSLAQVPAGCEVVRTRCLDAGRHLSIRGRYPAFAALPDRWASWQLWAARAGERLARERGVRAIWSTYPIATAHKIGATLARRTGLPWIADFRDPMAQEGYPADPRRWQAFKRIEETAAEQASRLVFVSPSALELYRGRYPGTPPERFVLIENGYDESSFDGLPTVAVKKQGEPPVLLHSGIVYPSERDPGALFEALGRLARDHRIEPGDFVIRFRASVHEDLLRTLADRHGVSALIDIQPAIAYREALSEMLGADALLVMQGANCNEQIPAKLYEYLRAGRPIFGLADPAGDTGRTLAGLGYPLVTPLESADAIERALPAFLQALRAGTLPIAQRAVVDRYSRRTLTGRFAALLDQVTAA
jgi:glycosyltransferase involved in cell wall biosynthesis